MRNTIREVLYCGLLIVAIAIGVRVLFLIDHIDATVVSLPKLVDDRAASIEKDLAGQLDHAIQDANERVNDAVRATRTQVAGLRDDVTGKVLLTLDSRMASIQKDVNSQFTTLNQTAASTAKPLASVFKQADDSAPFWLDCEFNPDCAFNRYQGTAKAVEKTMQVIAAEAPRMTVSAEKIAVSSAGVADSADKTGKEVVLAAKRFNAPQTKWQAFRMWLVTFARVGSYF